MMDTKRDEVGGAAASTADDGDGSARRREDTSTGSKRPRPVATAVLAGADAAPSSPSKRSPTTAPCAAAYAGMGVVEPTTGAAAALRSIHSQPAVEGHLPGSSAAGGSRLPALYADLRAARDELCDVQQSIQKKEALKEVVGKELGNIEEQLAQPGLSAKDDAMLRGKWQVAIGNIKDANLALAGLRPDERQLKDNVVALQKQAAAAETASKVPVPKVPSALLRVEAAELPGVRKQYARHQLDGAELKLRGSDGVISVIQECALDNLAPAGGKSNVLVVSGPSGSGKTRVGFEALCRSNGLAGDLLQAIAAKAGCTVLTIPLFIDFNNGYAFDRSVDEDSMDKNLGVRLAARALSELVGRVKDANGRSLDGLYTADVLTAIAKAALRQASEAGASPPGVILLALHLDEYQTYVQNLMKERNHSLDTAVLRFKEMMSAVNNWVSSAEGAVGVKVVFLPVVTGTPVAGLPFVLTDKLRAVLISPGRLVLKTSAELFADVLTAGAERSPLRPSVLEALLVSAEARNALGDTDFLPRHVVYLAREALKVLPASADGAAMVAAIDWAVAMGPVVMSTMRRELVPFADTLALLALSQAPVHLFVPGPSRATPDLERAVIDADVAGVIKLEAAGDGRYVVRVPLVQLRRWGLSSILPARLLFHTICTWQEVEVMVGYCLTAMLQPGLRSKRLFIQDLFPGALGCDELRPRELTLEEPRSLYVEQTQFIASSSSVPPKQMVVLARKEFEAMHDEVLLTDGVFLTCPGTAAVDIRCSLRMMPRSGNIGGVLHVFVQTKHSGTSSRISEVAVDTWYKAVTRATKEWRSDQDQVLFVYFTNKPPTDDGFSALSCSEFFKSRPGLLVVTHDQLSGVLPSFLLTRLVTPAQQERFVA